MYEMMDMEEAFIFLCLSTSLLVLYIMQQTWHDRASQGDPKWLQWIRRFGYMLVALMLAWSANYAATTDWRPAPPIFGLIMALMLVFFVRAIILTHAAHGKRKYPVNPPLVRH